jgi:hypothetical protein
MKRTGKQGLRIRHELGRYGSLGSETRTKPHKLHRYSYLRRFLNLILRTTGTCTMNIHKKRLNDNHFIFFARASENLKLNQNYYSYYPIYSRKQLFQHFTCTILHLLFFRHCKRQKLFTHNRLSYLPHIIQYLNHF